MSPLILGTQSPRRLEIFSCFDLPFEQASSSFDENSVHYDGDPIAYAAAIAKGKADELYPRFLQRTILTADTVVYCEGKVYGKPHDAEDALSMLAELAGKWQSVFTAVTLRRGHEEFSHTEETRVLMNPLTKEQIKHYCEKMQPYDKAGSYQIQMPGGLIVRQIEGCYYNVVGLPINTVRTLLKSIGIELWDHLR